MFNNRETRHIAGVWTGISQQIIFYFPRWKMRINMMNLLKWSFNSATMPFTRAGRKLSYARWIISENLSIHGVLIAHNHISNGLKRNMEKQRQSYFDCFFAVDCGQFMVQAQSIFTCNVLWSSSRSGSSQSFGNGYNHFTMKAHNSTYLANQ